MTDAKRVGDAWGKLAGLVVDACKSHHESHSIVGSVSKTGERERDPARPGGDNDELIGIILTASQRCKPSWVKRGEVELLIKVPGPIELVPPQMRFLPADALMSNAVYDGLPTPPNFMTAGQERVHIVIPPTLPRGLYVGRLTPTVGNVPNTPVLIYIDDVV